MATATPLDSTLPPETRAFYSAAMRALDDAGVLYLVGGAYALHEYTGIERHTKDFDIFVRQADCRPALDALAAMGCRTELTFPHWLGKAYRGDDFIDIIFSSGNALAPVDDAWFEHAVAGEVLGRPARLVPPEEMIWQKCYIQERERYDGADVAHILRARGPDLDWRRLLSRFGPYWRVLFGQLVMFGFVYPSERDRVPSWVMNDLTTRLLGEVAAAPPAEQVCQGTLLSREQYLIDVERWGYLDARERPLGAMSHADIASWTRAITAHPSPPMEHTIPFGAARPQEVPAMLKTHPPAVLAACEAPLLSLAISPDGERIAAGDSHGLVRFWRAADSERCDAWQAGEQAVRSLAFSPDGALLAAAGRDGVRLWDAARGEPCPAPAEMAHPACAVAFSPDGGLLAAGREDGTVVLWDMTAGKVQGRLSGRRGAVTALAFAPGGGQLAAGGDDHTVRLWDVAARHETARLAGHLGAINALAFDHDGGRLATASDDMTAIVWEARTGRRRVRLVGHAGLVEAVAFLADGLRVVSAGEDWTLRLWDAATGHHEACLSGHYEAVWALAPAPDGETVYSAGEDGSVRAWDVAAV